MPAGAELGVEPTPLGDDPAPTLEDVEPAGLDAGLS
jgi:hypothetical protein